MKNGFVKVVRVLCIIVMLLDIIGTIALFSLANKYGGLGVAISNWQSNPFNMTTGSDARVINTAILFIIIPLIIFIAVGSLKKKDK